MYLDRLAPPKPPSDIVITVEGKNCPLKRELIIEKLPKSKQKKIIIEKWLPYRQLPAEVIFEPADPIPDPIINKESKVQNYYIYHPYYLYYSYYSYYSYFPYYPYHPYHSYYSMNKYPINLLFKNFYLF